MIAFCIGVVGLVIAMTGLGIIMSLNRIADNFDAKGELNSVWTKQKKF